MICESNFHRRSNAQGLMHSTKVVVHEMHRYSVPVILDFFTKSVREASKPDA
jgi:hypothetical protein